MEKGDKRVLYFTVAVLAAVIFFALCGLQASAQQITKPQVLSNAVANKPINFDVSRPLAELAIEAPFLQSVSLAPAPLPTKLPRLTAAQPNSVGGTSVTRESLVSPLINATVGLSFEGVGNTAFLNCPSAAGRTVAPPDTNAAVGDTQVVQWVNLCYAVFDKSTGSLVAGPFAGTNF